MQQQLRRWFEMRRTNVHAHLLLSEVETRAAGANAMQRLEANHAELLVQHQKMQERCNSQARQLQVNISLHSSIHKIRAVPSQLLLLLSTIIRLSSCS